MVLRFFHMICDYFSWCIYFSWCWKGVSSGFRRRFLLVETVLGWWWFMSSVCVLFGIQRATRTICATSKCGLNMWVFLSVTTLLFANIAAHFNYFSQFNMIYCRRQIIALMQTLFTLFWMQMELEKLILISTFHMLCIWNLRTSLKLPIRRSSLAYLGMTLISCSMWMTFFLFDVCYIYMCV